MVNETIKYTYNENEDIYAVEIIETGAERTVDGITVREVFEIFEDEVNNFDEEKLQDMEIIREIIDVVCAITHTKQYIIQLALMVYGVLPITPKNNYKGDNMIEKIYDTVEEQLEDNLFYFGAFAQINEDKPQTTGRLYVKNDNTVINNIILNIVNETINNIDNVEIDINRDIDMKLGYLFFNFEIKVTLSNFEIKVIEDFEETLNNIEYNKIAKEQYKEECDFDKFFVCEYKDENGEIKTFIDTVEEKIEGDWYYRASGGGFSSEADYWNYILG